MTDHGFNIKVLVVALIGAGFYETLLQYDGIFTLLTRWSIAILTIVYLIIKISKQKKYGKTE